MARQTTARMRSISGNAVAAAIVALLIPLRARAAPASMPASVPPSQGFTDAGTFGFSPDSTGRDNTMALQRAVDQGGTILVSRPGTYPIAGTVFVGSQTTLKFGDGVFIKKVADDGPFCHVLLNKGALTRTWDDHITVDGLQIIVNGVDERKFLVYGLHGQLAFFYARDVHIQHFRCLDLGRAQYGIQVCTFEDLTVEDAIIKGLKDGVHLGRGKRFTIRDCVFETGDDAVALNGHDYATGNPELGWIEDGLVNNCRDLADEKKDAHSSGYFCRILAGAWTDWHAGMEVQQSDTVVANHRLYRVQEKPDGTIYKSNTCPSHLSGQAIVDGIHWGVVQTDVTHTAGVRNVVFRDIFLAKPRTAFSIHFDTGRYSRSYYPGAPLPMQEQIVLEDVHVLHNKKVDFLSIGTPIDAVTISHCSLGDNRINFHANKAIDNFGKTSINITNCVFRCSGDMNLLTSNVAGKVVNLKTSGNLSLADDFSARIVPGGSTVLVDSDLTGLRKPTTQP